MAVVAALMAGVPAVPINPRLGTRELQHVISDSSPELVLATPGALLPVTLRALPRLGVDLQTDVDLRAVAAPLPGEPDPESPALIVDTSGTTGAPKGVVLPRRTRRRPRRLGHSVAMDRPGRSGARASTVSRALSVRDHQRIAAATGEPDPDPGERVVAWVVTGSDPPPTARELTEHVASLLAPHKRPRVVRFLPTLPRNDMAKVRKNELVNARRFGAGEPQ